MPASLPFQKFSCLTWQYDALQGSLKFWVSPSSLTSVNLPEITSNVEIYSDDLNTNVTNSKQIYSIIRSDNKENNKLLIFLYTTEVTGDSYRWFPINNKHSHKYLKNSNESPIRQNSSYINVGNSFAMSRVQGVLIACI